MLVDRRAAGLDEEDVGAADRLAVATVGLAVGERLQLDLTELDAEPLGDPLARARGASDPRTPSAASAASAGGRGRASSRAPAECPARARAVPAQSSRFPPRPSLSTCLGGHPTRALSRDVVRDHEPAAVHASSPSSTGATNDSVDADPDVTPDRRAALRPALLVGVVRGDRACADVRTVADVGVSEVREMGHLRALADAGCS